MTTKRLLARAGIVAAVAVPVLVLLTVTMVLPPVLVAAQREEAKRTPADYGLEYEDVSFETADGLTINGWWMPDATPPGTDALTGEPIETEGVIVFVHGANANRGDHYASGPDIFRLLTSNRHHVLTIDLRNSGTSQASTTGRLDMGRAEARDVIAAVEFAQQKGGGIPIIAMGVSMGGGAAIHATAQDERIRGLILVDPVLETYDSLVNGAYAAAGVPAVLGHPIAASAGLFHGVPAFEDTPLEAGKEIDEPILLIQDEADPVNRRIHAEKLAAANRNVDLWVAPHPGDEDPRVIEGGRWGTHVAAFRLHPEESAALVEAFLTMVHAICRTEDAEAALAAGG